MRSRTTSVVAIFSAAALFSSGCSAEYSAERLYWHAEQKTLAVSMDPVHATPDQVEEAVKVLEKVVQKSAGNLSAAKAQFAIGSLYAIRKQYPQAREAYERVIRNHGQFPGILFATRVALANLYRAERNHDGLVAVYRQFIQFHPWTPIGLEAPLLLAQDVEQQATDKNSSEVQKAYQSTLEYYFGLIGKAPSEGLTLRVKGYLARVYQRLGKSQDATKLLAELENSRGLSSATVR